MSETATTALVFDASGAQQGAAQFEVAGQKIIAANQGVVGATTRTVDAQGNMERALARLTRQIDPAAAAQSKLEQGQRLLERAFQRGTITADEQARRLTLLDTRYAAAAAGAQRFATANDNAVTRTRNLGAVMGQAGFQIQDFAVQVSAGQSALVALGQQGSQMLGVFGTAGAIAGAILTVGILAAQFVGLSGKADDLNDAIETQSSLFRSAREQADQYGKGLEEQAEALVRITAGYRAASEQARAFDAARLTQAQTGLARQRGLLDTSILSNLMDRSAPTVSIPNTSPMGDIGGTFEQVRQLTPAMRQLRQALDEFGSKAVVTSEDVATLYARLVTLDGGSRQANDAIRTAAAGLLAAAPEYQRLAEAQREGAVQMLALREAAGASGEELDRYAARFGTLAVQVRAAGAQLNALRQGAIGTADDRIAGEIQRNEAVLRALRTGGREAAEAMRDRGDRQQEILRRASDLEASRIQELTRAGRTMEQAREEVREYRTEWLATATTAYDTSQRIEQGLKRQAAGAREVSQEYGDLRRNSQGLLVQTRQDEVAVRAILTATNNSVLDPDKLRNARAEAERLVQGARTETEKYAETLERLRPMLDGTAESQALYNRAVAAADPAIAAARKATEEQTRQSQQAANQMESTFSGAFTRAFEAGEDAGKSFLESIKRGVKSLAATIASQLVFRMAVVPVVNGVGSMLGAGGNLLGTPNTSIGGINLGGWFGGAQTPASTSGGLMSQFGNMSSSQTVTRGLNGFNPGNYISGATPFNTGFGGLDGALNAPIFSEVSLGAAGPMPSGATVGAEMGGITYGGAAMGALGVAGGLYGVYSGIQKGGVGGGFGVAGGAATAGLSAAAMAGLAVPVYGWIAAAVLTIIGALLPGQKASGRGQEFRSTLDGITEANGLGGDRYSPQNAEQARGAVTGIVDLARQIGDKLGGLRFGGDVAVGVTSGRKDGDPGKLYLEVNGQKGQYSNDEEGAKQLSEEAARFILEAFKSVATGDMAGILNASGNSLETLQQNLDWYDQVYKKFGETAVAASAFQASLDQITAAYQVSIDKANSLSLATDAISAARDKEVDALQRQRDTQLAVLHESLAMRDALSSASTALSSISRLSQITQWRAWAGEVDGLTQQLTALGETTEAVVAQIEILKRAQGQEYWQNFADQMAANDRDTITRILRSTGRAAQADMLDFDAEAAATISNLRRALAQWPELDAATINKKIMEKEEALAAQRIELAQRVADEASQAQQEAAAAAKEAWDRTMAAGQSLRAFIDAQRTTTGPGGVSPGQALAQAQDQFGRDLTLARGGDQDALGRITTTADRLLQAGQAMYASGVDFQTLKTFVLNSLENLPATRSYDEMILEELKKLGGRVDVEVDLAVIRIITEQLNALPDEARAKLVQAQIVLRTIEEKAGRFLTAQEIDRLINPATVDRTVQQFLGRDLTASERAGILQAATIVRNVEQALGRNLTAAERAAVVLPGDIIRNISQAIETTETVQISRSIDDKLSGVMSDVRHNTEITAGYLNRIDVYTNAAQQHLAVMRVNLNQLATWAGTDGLMVRSSAWSHANSTNIMKFAEGGRVYGGIPGVDSVHALLMPGEGVLRKSAMDRLGGAFEELQRGEMPVRPFAVPVGTPAGNDNALAVEMRAVRAELGDLKEENRQLRQDMRALLQQLTRVVAAVGEEQVEQGAETNRLLARQESQQRLAG